MKIPPNEQDLHAYVDDQLDERERIIIENYLAQHPHIAHQVQCWREDTQRLRTTLAWLPLPDVTTQLDPIAINHRRVRATYRRMRLAASFILCIGLGLLGGWQAHSWQASTMLPMGDALSAYRLMVIEKSIAADFSPDRPTALTAWIMQHVGKNARMPDLRQAGFTPASGRLFATEQGVAAMVLYRDKTGHILSFYIRQPDPRQPLLSTGQRTVDGLVAHYGSSQGLNYAVVGPASTVNNPVITHELDKQI